MIFKKTFSRFYPDEYYESIGDIDYDGLYERGIRGLIFDIDNTIEGYGSEEPSKERFDLLTGLIGKGFSVCLVSNNSAGRVEKFNRLLKIPATHKSGKPSRAAAERAAGLMGLELSEITVIGDQVFTDVWMGKVCGCHTVLVKPVTDWDPWIVKLKRVVERRVIKKYLKKR